MHASSGFAEAPLVGCLYAPCVIDEASLGARRLHAAGMLPAALRMYHLRHVVQFKGRGSLRVRPASKKHRGTNLQPSSDSLTDVPGAGSAAASSGGDGAEMPIKGSAGGCAPGAASAVADDSGEILAPPELTFDGANESEECPL